MLMIAVVGLAGSLVYSLTGDALRFFDRQSIGKKAMRIRVLKKRLPPGDHL